MSKNTKVTENKNTKATEKTTTKKPVAKKAEPKTEVVKFSKKDYGENLIKSFKNDTVDLVFDTDFTDGPRAMAMSEYNYIHVFRKGTTKNCFQIYISNKVVRIVVGKNIDAMMPESKKYTKQGVVRKGKLSYYNYLVKHEDVAEVLTALIDAYKTNNAQLAEKKAAEEKTKAEKAKAPKKEVKAKSVKTA